MSPILVRPVREQLEHDRVIRVLQAKWRRRHQVDANPGAEQNAPAGSGTAAVFPDLVFTSLERGRRLEGVVEVETAESVHNLEAMAEWVPYSRLRAPFYLYVPAGSVDVARRLCADHQIPVQEIWSYYTIGDEVRFAMVHRAPAAAGRQGPAPARSAAPARRKTATSARRKTATPARRKTAAPARRKTAKSARRKTAAPARRKTAPRARRKAAPARRKAAPARRKSAPARRKAAPARRKAARSTGRKAAAPSRRRAAAASRRQAPARRRPAGKAGKRARPKKPARRAAGRTQRRK